MEKPFSEWSFRNHVQPVLAKAGCSSALAGACHGAAAGQNGFKLSLRGYDNEGDFLTLTRSALGRRVIPSDPGRSLMLLKPTTAVPHKGGKRFDVDSIDYRVIADWIASGTPGTKPRRPTNPENRIHSQRCRVEKRRCPATHGVGHVQRRPQRRRDPLGQVQRGQRNRHAS